MARVLVSVYGSAGDLFPVVPVILRLRDKGHDVRCVLSRPLAFYMKPLGVPVYSLGKGAEMRIPKDSLIVTTRFDGWDSVRRLTHRYAGETLAGDIASVEELLDTWTPDVVVSSTSAASARIAAHRRRIPRAEVCVFPALLARVSQARRFALGYRLLCADLAGLSRDEVDSDLVGDLAWGAGEDTILLHDPELLARSELARTHPDFCGWAATEAVGFPYWDDALRRRLDVDSVERWLDQPGPPSVAVTLGSYLGARRRDLWAELAGAVKALGLRTLFLGPRRELEEVLREADCAGVDCMTAGFVPLSRVMGRVVAVLHHGGVGTTFAAVRAGTPAVVAPRAFDQPFNARLVEDVGAGLAATDGRLGTALEQVLANGDFARRAGEVAQALVHSDVAIQQAVQGIEARLHV